MKRVLPLAIAVLLGLFLIATAYGGLVSPTRLYALGSVLTLLFPVVSWTALAVTVIMWFWSKRAAAVLTVSLLVCGPVLWANCPINLSEPEVPLEAPRFKLMTYNVLQMQDFDGAGDNMSAMRTILAEQPDIVALQECWGGYGLADGQSHGKAEMDSILRCYPYRLFSPGTQTLLSRWPACKVPVIIPEGMILEAAAFEITLPDDTGTVTVLNLHLASIGLTDDDKALYCDITRGRTPDPGTVRHTLLAKLRSAFVHRAEQAHVVASIVDSLRTAGHERIVVCGDFNDVTYSYAQRTLLAAGLSDAYTAAANGPAITYQATRMWFRIDHILYTDRTLTPLDVRRIRSRASDHCPLVTEMACFPYIDNQ